MMLTRRMREYRSETERLLFHLPLCGSAFRKVYFDKRRNRPVSLFIPATDVVIPTDPTHLDWCPRIFHVQMTNAMDLDRRMADGRTCWTSRLPTPAVTPSILNPLSEQVDKLMGYEPSVKADGGVSDHRDDDRHGARGFRRQPRPDGRPTHVSCPYPRHLRLRQRGTAGHLSQTGDEEEMWTQTAETTSYLIYLPARFRRSTGIGLSH